MKILYVDDNPQSRRMIRKMLHVCGYETLEAMDGVSGLAMAANENPDLILIDTNLFDLSGVEAAGRIKNDPTLHMIPLIAVTNKPRFADQERLRDAGYDGQLPKPITMSALHKTLTQFLEA